MSLATVRQQRTRVSVCQCGERLPEPVMRLAFTAYPLCRICSGHSRAAKARWANTEPGRKHL